MKQLLFLLCIFPLAVIAQTDINYLRVKDSLRLAGKVVKRISNDTALAVKDSTALITDYAAKKLIKPETDPIWLAEKSNYPTTSSIQATYPPFNGTGAYGTWPINISGNAATVSNGVYTNGSYSNPSWLNSLAYSKVTGAPTALSQFSNDVGYITGSYTGFDSRYQPLGATNLSTGVSGVLGVANGGTGQTTLAGVQSWLGLGSNAYTSTAYLPITGGNINGNLNIFNNSTGLYLFSIGSGNPGKRLYFTYDYNNLFATIQSVNDGIAYTDINLNPNGGNVSIGTNSNPSAYKLNVNGTIFSNSDISTSTQFNAGPAGYNSQLIGGFANNAVLVNVNNDNTKWSIGSNVGSQNVSQNRNLNFNYLNGTSWANLLNITPSGAATFASSVTATAFYNSSDRRLKQIISRKGDMVTFRWNDGRDKLIHYGYIAQEVRKTMPNQVMKDNNGYLSVNYTEVHTKKINELENEVAELKQQINELKKLLKALQK